MAPRGQTALMPEECPLLAGSGQAIAQRGCTEPVAICAVLGPLAQFLLELSDEFGKRHPASFAEVPQL